MPEPRMNELAQELLRRSRERKVPWEERPRTSRLRESYRVIFPEGALILTRGEGPLDPGAALTEEYDGYELELIGDTGRIIDSLTPKPEEPMHQTLAEIFDLAEGYVRERGINKALDFLKSR